MDELCAENTWENTFLPYISPKYLWEALSILPGSSLSQTKLINQFWEAGSGVSKGLGCASVMELRTGSHAFISLSKNWDIGGKNVEMEGCSLLWFTGKRENSHFLLKGKIPGKAKLSLSSLFLWAGAATEPFPDIFIFEMPDCFNSIAL